MATMSHFGGSFTLSRVACLGDAVDGQSHPAAPGIQPPAHEASVADLIGLAETVPLEGDCRFLCLDV
jgi:hypothetical protein